MINVIKKRLQKMQPSSSVHSAALIIAIAGILSRILGLVRDRILASNFGAGDVLDTYYAAFRVPDLIYNLLILGALSAAFIPVFTGLLAHEKKEEAWKFTNALFSFTVTGLILLSALLAILTPFFMKLITPGFSKEKLDGVVILTRIMFLSPIFLGISGIYGSILNSFKRFLIYSLAPIFYNIGIIIGAVYLYPILGVSGLAWGVVFGAFLHMIIQYPAVKISGYKFILSFDWKDSHLRKVAKLMIPRTMSLAVAQINLLVITILASTLVSGSLSIFNFANNLQSFPIGIFAVPFVLAIFPTLSHFSAKKDNAQFIASFSETFRQILFFIIPSTIFILVLRAQIVRVILGSGQFNWNDTILTFQSLGIFAISLFAQCLIPLIARAFFAFHNTVIPFIAGIISEVFNLGLALIFARYYGVLGLVWAFSISNIIEFVILIFILRSKMGSLDDKRIINSTLQISLAAIAGGAVAQLTKYFIVPFINPETFFGVFSQMLASGSLGIIIFLAISYYFKLPELTSLKKLLSVRSLLFKQSIPEDPTEASGI
jgi:putative peptidoglycan lipid II flippase